MLLGFILLGKEQREALKKEEAGGDQQQHDFDDLFRFCIHERHCSECTDPV